MLAHMGSKTVPYQDLMKEGFKRKDLFKLIREREVHPLDYFLKHPRSTPVGVIQLAKDCTQAESKSRPSFAGIAAATLPGLCPAGFRNLDDLRPVARIKRR